MICTISKHRAERRGYADAMMLDWQGRVAECTGANIFFVKDGVIHTPIADCFLDGITRQTVIELARRRGVEVVERRIMPEELAELQRMLHHRHGRRSDAGRRDRPRTLHARRADRGADRRLHRRSDAEVEGGVSRLHPAALTKLSSTILRPARSNSTVSFGPSTATTSPLPNLMWNTRAPTAN